MGSKRLFQLMLNFPIVMTPCSFLRLFNYLFLFLSLPSFVRSQLISLSPGADEITDCACNAGYTGPNGQNCTACAADSYKVSTGKKKALAHVRVSTHEHGKTYASVIVRVSQQA